MESADIAHPLVLRLGPSRLSGAAAGPRKPAPGVAEFLTSAPGTRLYGNNLNVEVFYRYPHFNVQLTADRSPS